METNTVILSPEQILAHRAKTFCTAPGTHLAAVDEAIKFVDQRGFVFFWPPAGLQYPSLWTAVAGDRPVADEHDDPGHITWGWKDGQLGKKTWYYGRVIRKKNALISINTLPYFYALSPNYGDPDQDYLLQYEQGVMTMEAKSVYEALLNEGALDTISLRKASRLSAASSASRFNRALEYLQMEFKVLPVGISDSGAWHYSFTYDLTHRHFPNLIEEAGKITEPQARKTLAALFFETLGAARATELAKLFHWTPINLQRTLDTLEKEQIIQPCQIDGQVGEFFKSRNLG